MRDKIVHRIEADTDREDVLCTTYQMRNFYRQLGDGYFTNLDVMNYIQHLKAVQMMKPGWKVLDVCCGRGLLLPLIRWYRKEIGEYVGVDIREKNVREAQTRTAYKQIDHETYYEFPHKWLICSVAEMSEHLPASHFDFAVYTSSIEHMHKEAGEQSLHECSKVVKPGARLFLSCPNTPEDQDGYDTQYKAHVYEWKLSELRLALRSAGFEIEREYGLVIGKRELQKAIEAQGEQVKLLLQPILDYLPTEFLTAALAPAFPVQSKEVLIVARRREAGR
jgi:2-polyprenyl-3-methyl-5-hydroxy-6-metoxy-1,4-benzoquinol methylase